MSSDPSLDSTEPSCSSCRKSQNEVPNSLKRCAKCKSQWYCSRDCQKSDWKNHKKVCGSTPIDPATPMFNTTKTSSAGRSSKPGAVCYIPNPFTALNNGTWLHNRPKKDVFKLLVDTYRMRVEDEYVFQGDVDEGSLYSGAGPANVLRHFKQFLNKTIRLNIKNKLLPEWWSNDSLKECIEFARTDDFSNINYAVEKHDLQEHYSQMDMPMQLRMFSEKIDGTLAAGMSGEAMLQMQVAVEKNNLSSGVTWHRV